MVSKPGEHVAAEDAPVEFIESRNPSG